MGVSYILLLLQLNDCERELSFLILIGFQLDLVFNQRTILKKSNIKLL